MGERLFVRLDEDGSHGPESDAPSGSLRRLPVPISIQPLVSDVLSYREHLAHDEEVVERVLPDGAARLIYFEEFSPGHSGSRLSLAGPSITPAMVRLRGRVQGLSITLRPGAATLLFGMPACEFAESSVPIPDLWPGEGRRLLDRLAMQPDPASQARVLLQALSAQASGASLESLRRATQAVRTLLAGSRGRRPSEVAAALGVGERRLQQLFREHVGLAPKAISRLARMHDLLRALRHEADPAWAELAPHLGYYDQAHLANEFRALSGLTPSQFLARSVAGISKTTG